ncbi:hypothetical protein [Microbacterium trichothecenolyticum]|uniref:Sec-independent protein translocase protein TatB n=1 Tax=Microbacterium trichothecenolyticum TaxID=69370 RepID=A0ABU0TRE5_MICTR|nr:hypothetical protein [Microbacterium trichothecenolyticum]MDQ1122236.1 hypothetical protein [Microbacterium trichothecenolyticum]
MDIARDAALLLTAVGGTVLVPKIAAALWGALTGRAGRQRREIDRVRRDVDEEAYRRRLAEEHASACRRVLLEAPCVDPADIPAWPTYHRRKDME